MTRRTITRAHRHAPTRQPPLPVFVYGTLRPAFGDFQRILADATQRVQLAELPGAVLLDNQQYPYAILTSHLSEVVTGELVTLDPRSSADVLARLDRTFGCVPGGDDSRWQRRRVTVRCGAVARDAWVYVAADWLAPRLLATLPLVPSGDWARHVTSTWLAAHQRGRRGIGAHDGHGISWSTFDQTRPGVTYRAWPAPATQDAFVDPAPAYDDAPARRRHRGRQRVGRSLATSPPGKDRR